MTRRRHVTALARTTTNVWHDAAPKKKAAVVAARQGKKGRSGGVVDAPGKNAGGRLLLPTMNQRLFLNRSWSAPSGLLRRLCCPGVGPGTFRLRN